MKLIASTKVGNCAISIYEDEQRCNDIQGGVHGFWETDGEGNQNIFIKPGLAPDLYWETFYHELAHAMEASLGFEWDHQFIHTLGIFLAQMLQKDFVWFDKPGPLHSKKSKKKTKRTAR